MPAYVVLSGIGVLIIQQQCRVSSREHGMEVIIMAV